MYETLYEENKRLLSMMARRFAPICEKDRAVSVDDLVQSGFLGLVRARETFNETGRVGWKTHAKWCVAQEMRRALGIRNSCFSIDTDAVPLDNPISSNDPDSPSLCDLIKDDSLPASDEALLREELQQTVHKAVDSLNDPRQRQVVLLCAFQGRTFPEAGNIIGVTAGRALQLYRRAQSNLYRDGRLRALVDLDERTRFHAHKGICQFMSDRTSVTEEAAMWRIEQREKREGRMENHTG